MTLDDRELSPETRTLLSTGRGGHAISERHRRAIKRGVMVKVAAGGIATATTAAAWTSGTSKIVVGVLLLALGGGGLYRAVGSSRSAGEVTPAATIVLREEAPPAGPAVIAPPSHELGSPAEVTPEKDVIAAEPRKTGRETPTAHVHAAPPPVTATAPTVPAVSVSAAVVEEAPVAAPPVAPPVITPSSLAAEARLVREADRALRKGDPTTALRLLDEHAAQYPGGVLEPERSADRVIALCGLGRAEDAKREGATFLTTHPPGPLASRVRASCGGSP